MVFSDLFFLFVFLPAFALLYVLAALIDKHLLQEKAGSSFTARNYTLILFSLIFYAWGEPVYVLLMLGCVVITYLSGRLIGICKHRKAGLIIGLVCNLSILAVFKYAGLLVETLNSLGLHIPDPKIALPIGISFYIFQSISYLVDVYRKDSPVQTNFFNLLLYISMFPQLIAGPIVRYGKVAEELQDRHVSAKDLAEGMQRFMIGLGKKVVLANQFSELVDQFMGGSVLGNGTTTGAWIGITAFTLQIYFDFSGYSDMAIGLGRCMGFHFNENFNHPYISNSISEFWRRWHMSLYTFFRDYVYIPMGGNRRHQWLNICVVWSLTGLWHGANWTFALWGFYYALILLFEKRTLKYWKYVWRPFQYVYTMLLVMVGWVLFYFDDLASVGQYCRMMFGGAPLLDFVAETALMNNCWLFVIGLLFCMPVFDWLSKLEQKILGDGSTMCQTVDTAGKIVFGAAVLLICICLLVGATNNAFIYTRF